MNKYLHTIVITSMTTKSSNYPTQIEIKHDGKTGWVVIEQTRTIDNQRILHSMGRLSLPETKEVKAFLRETYVD